MFAHPYIGIPTSVQCFLRSVTAKRDLKMTRKQSVATAYLAQIV